MGFGCLGRAIGATYSASAARHSICGIKQVQTKQKQNYNKKKKSSLLQVPKRYKHIRHDESNIVYNHVAVPETQLVDSLITDCSIIGELCPFCFYCVFCGTGARGNACLSSLFCGRTRRNFGLRMPHCCNFPVPTAEKKKWQFEVTQMFWGFFFFFNQTRCPVVFFPISEPHGKSTCPAKTYYLRLGKFYTPQRQR